MIRLIQAELYYNRRLFLSFLIITPSINLMERFIPDAPTFYVLVLMWMMVLYWQVFKSKAGREAHWFRLPLSHWKIAAARLMVPLLTSSAVGLMYLLCASLFSGGAVDKLQYTRMLGYTAVNMIVFSLYYAGRDLWLPALRHNRYFSLTRERTKMLLLFAMVFINLLGIYTFIVQPKVMIGTIEFIVAHNPFATVQRNLMLTASAGLTMLISLLAFHRRKIYLEEILSSC